MFDTLSLCVCVCVCVCDSLSEREMEGGIKEKESEREREREKKSQVHPVQILKSLIREIPELAGCMIPTDGKLHPGFCNAINMGDRNKNKKTSSFHLGSSVTFHSPANHRSRHLPGLCRMQPQCCDDVKAVTVRTAQESCLFVPL